MSEKKHTPTPWKTLPEECDKPYIRIRGSVLGSRWKIANVITPVYYKGISFREAEETRANAEFIVRACNAHDDLVAALEEVQAWGLAKDNGHLNQITHRDAIVEMIDVALAKAGAA